MSGYSLLELLFATGLMTTLAGMALPVRAQPSQRVQLQSICLNFDPASVLLTIENIQNELPGGLR